jgi:ferredoxin
MKYNFLSKSHILVFGLWLFLFSVSYSGYSATKPDNNSKDTIQVVSDDEFGEFTEFNANTDTSIACGGTDACSKCPNNPDNVVKEEIFTPAFWWIIAILCFTILTGFLVRHKATRQFRVLFLLASIVFLGVYRGPCPCMISSFENTVLVFAGVEFHWVNLIWFLGLIPITYIFGRVFCGWICHLGALQEFLFRPGKWNVFKGKRSRLVMKIMQYVLFVVLIVQLLIQQKIFWCKIDPFLSIYQLMLAYNYEILSAVLIGLLVISSLVSYRPFCKAVCPVGLVLGWIEKIPGAAIIGLDGGCVNCSQCSNACKINAITREEKQTKVDNEECIMCGECMDACKKTRLEIFRISKKHKSKFICNNHSCSNDINCK